MEFDYKNRPGQRLEKKCIHEPIDPKVSIITPYYNSDKNFLETYQCVINQTFELFEWIIVDDGSTDQADVQKLEMLAESDCRIKLFHTANGGQSKAKNYGMEQSKTDIIIFLDADDLIEDFYVEYLYLALEKHPDAGWSYTDLVGFEGEEYVWCKPFSAGRMTFNNFLVNAAAFRKKLLEGVGGFSEITKHYDEDWALYLKLLAENVHPVHIPVIGFWYRRSQNGMQKTVRNNMELRKKSDEYIDSLAKNVNIRLKEEIFDGELPDTAIKSQYSFKDILVGKMCGTYSFLTVVKKIYRRKQQKLT